MVQFAFSITHRIYFRTRDKIYRIFENAPWLEVNQDEITEELRKCQETGEKYMFIYDYQLLNKQDYWHAHPQKIVREELDFLHCYGLLDEAQYLHFINNSAS